MLNITNILLNNLFRLALRIIGTTVEFAKLTRT